MSRPPIRGRSRRRLTETGALLCACTSAPFGWSRRAPLTRARNGQTLSERGRARGPGGRQAFKQACAPRPPAHTPIVRAERQLDGAPEWPLRAPVSRFASSQREGAVLERGRCATRLLPRGFTSPGVSFGLGRLSLAAKVLCWSLWLSARQPGAKSACRRTARLRRCAVVFEGVVRGQRHAEGDCHSRGAGIAPACGNFNDLPGAGVGAAGVVGACAVRSPSCLAASTPTDSGRSVTAARLGIVTFRLAGPPKPPTRARPRSWPTASLWSPPRSSAGGSLWRCTDNPAPRRRASRRRWRG